MPNNPVTHEIQLKWCCFTQIPLRLLKIPLAREMTGHGQFCSRLFFWSPHFREIVECVLGVCVCVFGIGESPAQFGPLVLSRLETRVVDVEEIQQKR